MPSNNIFMFFCYCGLRITGYTSNLPSYLAEYLGGNFGAAINSSSWSSDSPLQVSSEDTGLQLSGDFGSVSNICEEFISEILHGESRNRFWLPMLRLI